MRISTPILTNIQGKTRLSARVETETPQSQLPEDLWFEVPSEFEEFVYTGIESFVIAMLPFAMHLGEDIHFDEKMSPQLAFHIERAQQVLHFQMPRKFKRITLHHGGLREELPARASGVGLTFSGGVDSLYTLQQNIESGKSVPGYAITHGIFLFKFDLLDHEFESYQKAVTVYQDLFKRLGKTLVPASFNARDFKPDEGTARARQWQLRTHPFGLVGVGMFLSRGLGRQFLASAQLFNAYGVDYGGDFEIQHSLSTEWFEIIHDGLVEDRAQKTISLADWPESYGSLRVCWWDPDGVQNCGRCAKCVRTMTTLEAIGKLENYSTFPKPYKPQMILKSMTTIRGAYYLREMRDLARANGRRDLATRLSLAILISQFRAAVKSMVNFIFPNFRNPAA